MCGNPSQPSRWMWRAFSRVLDYLYCVRCSNVHMALCIWTYVSTATEITSGITGIRRPSDWEISLCITKEKESWYGLTPDSIKSFKNVLFFFLHLKLWLESKFNGFLVVSEIKCAVRWWRFELKCSIMPMDNCNNITVWQNQGKNVTSHDILWIFRIGVRNMKITLSCKSAQTRFYFQQNALRGGFKDIILEIEVWSEAATTIALRVASPQH